jgi:putative tricarboxylic transport membrane protein
MEGLLLGIENLAQTNVLIALLIGSVGGVVIGAVPGIGPAIAIAILLPATVFLDDLVSLVLLLGIYGSSMYGGAIPAILINTPGTPVNALTTYDGNAMTRRGEAQRALSLAYSSSFFGGCFSIMTALVCLIVFGPYLRDFGALFGQRDIFMAAVLGAVLLILAHRQTMAIAALLFGFGFLIAMVGRQSTRGFSRYTFDIEYLAAGFNLIVVIVGIFAISQALNLLTGKDDDPPPARFFGGLLRGLGELWRYKIIAFISACYGTVMGIIPGVGEFVAQFFSYATARSLSKNPSQFGHGAPEGLIASETANNAVPAAAMIPLLALGVPGEALTAMMMVVFFDAGIKPGPDIFDKAPDFLFSLFLALLVINILVVITLIFSTKLIAKMIYIPNRFLGAFILILAFVGVFSIRNSFVDCAFAAGFGFFGFVLRRLDWPLVPLVLGMVLGSIMIEKLTAGASQTKVWTDLVNRPISGGLAVIIVLVIVIFTGSVMRRRYMQTARQGR